MSGIVVVGVAGGLLRRGIVAVAAGARRPPTQHEARLSGAYLTDGVRLWRVVDGRDAHVQLENCRVPDEAPVWMSVRRVVSQMWLVRPA